MENTFPFKDCNCDDCIAEGLERDIIGCCVRIVRAGKELKGKFIVMESSNKNFASRVYDELDRYCWKVRIYYDQMWKIEMEFPHPCE